MRFGAGAQKKCSLLDRTRRYQPDSAVILVTRGMLSDACLPRCARHRARRFTLRRMAALHSAADTVLQREVKGRTHYSRRCT
ncbi:hypothetical protein BST61_g3668 [Cercospora zeina]